jgi:hypothetical protein
MALRRSPLLRPAVAENGDRDGAQMDTTRECCGERAGWGSTVRMDGVVVTASSLRQHSRSAAPDLGAEYRYPGLQSPGFVPAPLYSAVQP